MHVPRKEMEEKLKKQEKELADEINSLNKKVGSYYMAQSFFAYWILVEISGKAIQ